MGLGGYLFWTAAAREIHKKVLGGNQQIKFLPLEASGNGTVKLIKSEIFFNNPYFFQEFNNSEFVFPLVLNNQDLNYCKLDTPEKAVHRYDKHVVEQICEHYGIENPKINCEIYFSEEEIRKIDFLFKENKPSKKFITIEPQSNDEYSVNKVYPFDKWQNVVDELIASNICVVQIGRENKDKILNGVIDLTGKTTFREAAQVISRSSMFVSSEGGLMHAANGLGIKSLIVYTGYIHPKMTGYPENFNVWLNHDFKPCGMKIKCIECDKAVLSHNENEIVEIVKEYLK